MKEIYIGNAGIGNFSGVCGQTDPELFFPEMGSGVGKSAAIGICETSCDTAERNSCLEGALDRQEPYGVWGGKTTTERNRILGKQARTAS